MVPNSKNLIIQYIFRKRYWLLQKLIYLITFRTCRAFIIGRCFIVFAPSSFIQQHTSLKCFCPLLTYMSFIRRSNVLLFWQSADSILKVTKYQVRYLITAVTRFLQFRWIRIERNCNNRHASKIFQQVKIVISTKEIRFAKIGINFTLVTTIRFPTLKQYVTSTYVIIMVPTGIIITEGQCTISQISLVSITAVY